MTDMQQEFDWQDIQRTAGPYPIEAFAFVREGLGYTVDKVHASESSMHEMAGSDIEMDQHVSGQELCFGLRDFAIKQYGMLANSVLRHWHVNRTDDFGRIVFAMIEHGMMSKNDRDSMDDFRSVFDFEEEFAADRILDQLSSN